MNIYKEEKKARHPFDPYVENEGDDEYWYPDLDVYDDTNYDYKETYGEEE